MDKINNLIKHDPENGQWGDCFRCCVAMLLGLPAEEVPHFHYRGDLATPEERNVAVDAFLDPLGLVEISIPYDCEDRDLIISTVTGNSPKAAFMLSGRSRIGANHCVVCENGKIFHDPTGNGIVGPMSNGYYLVSFFAVKPAVLKEFKVLKLDKYRASGGWHTCEPEVIVGGGSQTVIFCKHCGAQMTGGRG